MTRIERRVLRDCVLVGALLTGIVVLAEITGWLTPTENWMYDLRARHFQFFAKPPTDKLVHLDIDDKALEGIGRWPWPRSQMAEIIDEVHAAGAKVVALDILYADPQNPSYEEPVSAATTQPAPRIIDHDALLAGAIRRSGNVIVPGSFILAASSPDALYRAVFDELLKDVELTDAEVVERVRSKFPGDPGLEAHVTGVYLQARREAVFQRIEQQLLDSPRTAGEIRADLIKRRDTSVSSPLSRLIDEQYVRAEAVLSLMRFGVKAPGSATTFVPARINYAPTSQLSKAMATTAFVDFKTSRDGVVRWQPLMLESNGRLFPQLGFSMALLYLGATPSDVTFTEAGATVACPDGRKIDIPLTSIYSDTLGREVPAIFSIPWFGRRDWETMYDWPDHKTSKQHVSMNLAYDPIVTRQKLSQNNAKIDQSLATIAEAMAPVAEMMQLDFSVPKSIPPDDIEIRAAVMDRFLKNSAESVEAYKASPPDKEDLGAHAFLRAVTALKNVQPEMTLLRDQYTAQRKKLRDAISGKAVLVGFTATGNQDAVPTSIHASCPGVVTHGAIFNAIVTEHFWSIAPQWMTVLFTLALGWLTAVIAWKFSPLAAFLITSLLGMAYVALNGIYFFDQLGQVVGLAAPQIAMASVWSGCSLARIVIESNERRAILRRFRSYVDPKVVDYMMEKEVKMDGEDRELSVCFCDIAKFTPLSEKLGKDIVGFLKEFMDLMVPIIREQHGTVDKFLGDGIMYFFGAPVPDSNHAADAVAAALLMQQAVGRLNASLQQRGLPTIGARIGINTGMMTVGDAGSTDAADYTVIGDNVNLASRLESVNKQLGTYILISGRTAELAGNRFLLRPIGSLQVVGKSEGVPAFTVCGMADGADSKDLKLCELTTKMVESFRDRRFEQTVAAADELDGVFGPTTLTQLYRSLGQEYLAFPPEESFNGTIVFKDK